MPAELHTASKWRIQSFASKVAAIFQVTTLSHYVVQLLITEIRSALFGGGGIGAGAGRGDDVVSRALGVCVQ